MAPTPTRRYLVLLAVLATAASGLPGQGTSDQGRTSRPTTGQPGKAGKQPTTFALPGMVVDFRRRCVDVEASVCLTRGTLELVACTRTGKTHESIVTIAARPMHIHTGLLLLGADPGHPAMRQRDAARERWVEVPPRGSAVEVSLVCTDRTGQATARPISAFVRRAGSAEAGAPPQRARLPTATFLFAGSRLVADGPGPRRYVSDLSGNAISLASFGDELLCLPGVHSHANGALLWEVDATHLPPVGTKVTLRLRPVPPPKKPAGPAKPARSKRAGG